MEEIRVTSYSSWPWYVKKTKQKQNKTLHCCSHKFVLHTKAGLPSLHQPMALISVVGWIRSKSPFCGTDNVSMVTAALHTAVAGGLGCCVLLRVYDALYSFGLPLETAHWASSPLLPHLLMDFTPTCSLTLIPRLNWNEPIISISHLDNSCRLSFWG